MKGDKQWYKSKVEWDRGGTEWKSYDGEVISSPVEASSYQLVPRGGDPTHQDRQHHRFQFSASLFFFSCVSIFFQVLSGSASLLKWFGATTLLLLSSFQLQNGLCSFNKACARV